MSRRGVASLVNLSWNLATPATVRRLMSIHCAQGLGKTITALALILKTRGLEPALPGTDVCRRRDGSGRDVAFYTGALPFDPAS